MRGLLCALSLLGVAGVASAAPGGAGATPVAIDLKKVPVGTWAEYSTRVGEVTVKSRWVFVGRERQGDALETIIEDSATPGGRMVMKMVIGAAAGAAPRAVKQMVMQMGDQDPIEMPVEAAQAQQQFQAPDPSKLVGKETIKVAGGSFLARHYHDVSEAGTSDVWISEQAAPMGMVKVQTTPAPGARSPTGRPMPPVTMELTARGTDGRPSIVKPPRPFNKSLFNGSQSRHAGPGR